MEDAVCTNESNVSPYLLRPRRSYAEIMGNAAVKTAQATGGERGVATGMSNRADGEGVASGIPKRGRHREDKARR